MSENPYEAPTFDTPLPPPSDAETIRKAHINTEASIKSIGILYYLGGIGLLLAAVGFVLGSSPAEGVTALVPYAIGGLLVVFSLFQFIVGSSVRKLRQWSRIAVGIMSGMGLLAFPVGTVINGYILMLIFGKKGSM